LNNGQSTENGKLDLVEILLLAVIGALLFVLFQLQGNTTVVAFYSRSVFSWMVNRWNDATLSVGDYSHGWLIPIVSAAAIWWKRRELAATPRAAAAKALWIVGLGLLLHFVGARGQQPRISLFGLVLLLWGIPFYLYGRLFAKLLIFPCFYLIFCIPFNFLDSLSFRLRIFATSISAAVLNGINIGVERSGSAIYSTLPGGFNLDVADPCSGIRSLLAMTALTVAYAHFTQKGLLKKTFLSLLSIPLAVIGNIARIISIATVANFFGHGPAMRFYHDYSGYVVFAVAVLLMMWVGGLLSRERSL
jgi:exosortase